MALRVQVVARVESVHDSLPDTHSRKQIDTLVLDLAEAEALVQGQRGVEALNVDAERLARRLRFGLQLPQQRRSDATIARVRQQRDVDDADLLRPARDSTRAAAR